MPYRFKTARRGSEVGRKSDFYWHMANRGRQWHEGLSGLLPIRRTYPRHLALSLALVPNRIDHDIGDRRRSQVPSRLVEGVSLPNGLAGRSSGRRATTTDFAVPSDNLWPGCLDDEYPQATGQTLVLFRHASCASRLLKKSATHGRKREHKGIQNGIELRRK
jgi:hypothetical protein